MRKLRPCDSFMLELVQSENKMPAGNCTPFWPMRIWSLGGEKAGRGASKLKRVMLTCRTKLLPEETHGKRPQDANQEGRSILPELPSPVSTEC